MAALTYDRKYKQRATGAERVETYKVAANVVIWNGALVSFNAAGFIIPAATTAGTIVVNIAQSRVDNTGGAAGDKEVTVKTGVRFNLVNATAGAAITQAHYGRLVYALDDQTVTNAAGIVAGVCDLIDGDGVWVLVDVAHNAIAQAAIAA
jgi:hypothetical protein